MIARRRSLSIALAALVMTGFPLAQGAGDVRQTEELSRYALLETGPMAKVLNGSGVVLGTVRDHVLAAGSGRVTHLVVETEVRSIVVPAERFEREPGSGDQTLPMDAVALAELPGFDAESFRREAARVVPASTAGADSDATARDAGRPRPERFLASDLVGRSVTQDTAGAEAVGTLRHLVLHPGAGHVTLLLVDTGSTEPIVLPWGAVSAGAPLPGTDRATLRLSHGPVELDGAPRLATASLLALDPGSEAGVALLARLEAFWGVAAEAALPRRE